MADPLHIQAPDGTLIEFPAGTSDDVIKGVMAKEYGAPKAQEEGGTLQTIREAIHAPTRILENGFLMGLGDRARAGMDAIIGNGSYGSNLKNEQAQTDQYGADHPVAAPVINAVGGAAAPLGVLGAAGKGTSLGAKFLYGAGAGAGLGGLQGAAGSKDWTDLPQTAKDTAVGAGVGGVLGAALPVAGKAIGSTYNAIANALTRTEGMSKAAAKPLIDALMADGAPAVQGKLQQLGPDAMLADAGPAFLGKAQGASLNSDEGRSVLSGALTTRNEGTNQRIMGDVNRALGPAEDPQTVNNAIIAHRSAVDNKSYPAALGSAPDVQTAPILTELDDAISRSVGMEKKALQNLKGMMMTTEKQPVLDTAGHPQYDSLGNQKFKDVPVSQNDAEVLHKVKGELDNVIQYDAPGLGVPAGAVKNQQAALKRMRFNVNDALEQQVPGYASANAESHALANRAEAVKLGTQYLGNGKTTPSPERFAGAFDPLSQGEKVAFAKGSRGEIERVLGTKANDLQALRGELQGEGGWNTAKIATVHGQPAADNLIGSVDRNLKFRDTYNKVVEGSQTDMRNAARKAMKPDPSSETPFFGPSSTMAGMGVTAAKKAAGAVVNALTRTDPTRSYGEVARILAAQGGQRDAHLAALVDALSRRQGHSAMAENVGNRSALIAAMLGNGYAQSHPMRRRSHQ